MSRSSKGFADFFPTAPSVLQQKRFKASQSRKDPRSPSGKDAALLDTSTTTHTLSTVNREARSEINGALSAPFHREQPSHVADESDTVHGGDLLNGVGSASSTSTSSSVFSTNHNAQGVALKTGTHRSASVTPLTNVESSPPDNAFASPGNKHVHNPTRIAKGAPSSRNNAKPSEDHGVAMPANTPILAKSQARPGKGEVKGVKVLYDPELDNTLSSREQRVRTVQEVVFGAEVNISQPTPLILTDRAMLTQCLQRTLKDRQRILEPGLQAMFEVQPIIGKLDFERRRTCSKSILTTAVPRLDLGRRR